jgi:ferredoxin-NADP reductase
MTAYKVALKRREPVARDTIAFTFEKPAGFNFKPGQAVELSLNRRPGDAAFLQELQGHERRHRGTFRLIATMTGAAEADGAWKGRTGVIDAELVRSVIVQPSLPVFYVAGPPAMVAEMRGLLNRMGFEDDDIRSEDFSGY